MVRSCGTSFLLLIVPADHSPDAISTIGELARLGVVNEQAPLEVAAVAFAKVVGPMVSNGIEQVEKALCHTAPPSGLQKPITPARWS
jgi:hypothetical protein